MKTAPYVKTEILDNTTDPDAIEGLENQLIETLELLGKLKLMSKLAHSIAKKDISSPLNQTLQKTWNVATWGSRSSHDYAKTIKYKVVTALTATPVSGIAFGKMTEKLLNDCPLLSLSCPPKPVVDTAI